MKFLFPDFKPKALTFSYDDGTTQDLKLLEIFRKYHLKATFNISSGLFGLEQTLNRMGFELNFTRLTDDVVRTAYKGFEIALHGLTHDDLTVMDDETFNYQILQDRENLTEVTGQREFGLVYPVGYYNQEVADKLRALDVKYARNSDNQYGFGLPEDFLLWRPTCHDHSPDVNELSDQFINDQSGDMMLFFIWGHSFELDKLDTDRWQDMDDLCAKLSGKPDVWYATNIEIYNYITAMRSVVENEQEIKNPSDMDLYLDMDGKQIILKAGETLKK